MRPWLLVCVAVAALSVAGPAAAADRVVERGIIQSLGPTAVVLRALDGTDLTIALGPDTRYRLNGVPVRRGRIRVGLVAEVVTPGDGLPALVLRAFGRVAPEVRSGVLRRVGSHAVVLRLAGGTRMLVPLTDRTVVQRSGRPVGLTMLRPGLRVRVRLAADGSARLVTVLSGAAR